MEVKINHLQHVGIPVTELSTSQNFYERLGFKNVMSSTFECNNEKGKVAMMKLGEIILELYQMPEPELNEIKNRKNGKIDHVAFDVDNIDQTYAAIKSAGFSIIEDGPVFLPFWEKGCKYFNILGPDEERLEFCQIL
ncbi:MAG TPA: VOC family protein [Flavisolibacter sp.]|jgi:catechol 2,3-dioxygenase-like lactoylglutathione lyase family enzyme|nr:VOC family protein [Flavisolibacter sp.]